MAVKKTEGNAFVERFKQFVQVTKDAQVTVLSYVAGLFGACSYSETEKPAVKPHDAAASNTHAAGKFAGNAGDLLTRTDVIVEARSIKPIYGERYERLKLLISDDKIEAIMREALNDPSLTPEARRLIKAELGRRDHAK